MQCNSNGSVSIESICSRNSFHGDGSEPAAFGLESVGILEMFRPQIRQQMPIHCFFRSVLGKPLPLTVGLRWSIKNVFFYQAALIELGPEFTKRLYSGVVVARNSFSNLKRKTNDESQTILEVKLPSLLDQPIRSTVAVLHHNPRERFCDSSFESVLP